MAVGSGRSCDHPKVNPEAFAGVVSIELRFDAIAALCKRAGSDVFSGWGSSGPSGRSSSSATSALTSTSALSSTSSAFSSTSSFSALSSTSSASSFYALAAHLWLQRASALSVPPSSLVHLFFLVPPASSYPPAPVAYYGLFTFNCHASCPARDLLQHPLPLATRLLRDAASRLHENFSSCMDLFTRLHCPCGFAPPEVLLLTDLPKLRKSELDFGVGTPANFIDDLRFPPQVNIAAVAYQSHNYDSLQIFMNNVPLGCVEKLRALVGNIPAYSCNDSKM